MVLISNWDAYMTAAETLIRSNPAGARLVTKYRHGDGKLVIKVTDNATCLVFKTTHASDVKRLEKLQAVFFSHAV